MDPDAAHARQGVRHDFTEWDASKGDYVTHSLPADLAISLSGPLGSWRVQPYRVDAFSRYLFDEIPMGRYILELHADGPYDLGGPIEVELSAPPLCHELNLGLHWKGTVRGRVIDAEGRPVPYTPVTIVIGRPSERLRNPWQETVSTDKRGEFTHRHLPAGDYTVGMYIDEMSRWERKHPAIYFPGVTGPDEAQAVGVTRGSELDIGDFRLPMPLNKVQVSGAVLLPDGTPVPDVWVSMHGVDDESFEASLETKTDGNGRFELTGVEGRRYRIIVSADVHDRWYDGSTEATAGGTRPVLVRLKESGP